MCILSTHQTKINTFNDKDTKVFPETCVSPMKTQGKKIVVFWLGSYLLVDSVAIGVSRRPNRPMLAGLLKLKKGDSVGEFMD